MIDIFISYSHEDEEWKDEVLKHLNLLQYNDVIIWDDRQIKTGDDWFPQIEKALNTAKIAILLISSSFFNSNFIRHKEIPALLKRRKEGGLRIIPLVIKDCDWSGVTWLAAIQGAVKNNQPLEHFQLKSPELNSQLKKFTSDIRALLDEINKEEQEKKERLNREAQRERERLIQDYKDLIRFCYKINKTFYQNALISSDGWENLFINLEVISIEYPKTDPSNKFIYIIKKDCYFRCNYPKVKFFKERIIIPWEEYYNFDKDRKTDIINLFEVKDLESDQFPFTQFKENYPNMYTDGSYLIDI